jgi:hypothetical protein
LIIRSWQAHPELVEGPATGFLSLKMPDGISCPEPIDGHVFVYILESADGIFYVGRARGPF